MSDSHPGPEMERTDSHKRSKKASFTGVGKVTCRQEGYWGGGLLPDYTTVVTKEKNDAPTKLADATQRAEKRAQDN